MICLPSYRYSGPMNPTTVLTSSGSKLARHRIGARFAGLLVDIVMGIGRQRRALPGLEVHHIFADRAAAAATRRLSRLAQQRQIDAEAAVGGLGARDRLEHQVDRRAAARSLRAWWSRA